MGTRKRAVTTIYLLVGILIFSLACEQTDKMRKVVPIFKNDPTEQTQEEVQTDVQNFVGHGQKQEVSVLGDLVTTCNIPYLVTGSLDKKGTILLEGIGPCISDYSNCSFSEDDKCAINAKGTLSDKKIVNIYSCNDGLEVTYDNVTVNDKGMAGSFECALGSGGGDTISLKFDILLNP